MNDDERATIESCALCHGQGTYRNGKHFFYAISLSASAAIMFLQWPPSPKLFAAVSNLCERLGLSDRLGDASIWVITAIPAIFGVAFFYAWMRFDSCPRCKGRHKYVLSEEARRLACMD